MPYSETYAPSEPARTDVDGWEGATLIEFGAPWCGHCQGAQVHIAKAMAQQPQLRHLKVEDGPGRPLGRSFRVKLWPTLVLMRDGEELGRVVRPQTANEIADLLLAA